MNLLEVCGLCWLIWIAGWLLTRVVVATVGRLCKSDVLRPQPNDYAVITGATDGIGLEYAKQLARKGYNLLLLSRTTEKLVVVSEEIATNIGQCQTVDYLAVDFAREDIYERIKDKLSLLNGNVAVLVNNVGMVNSIPEYFAQMAPSDFHRKLVNTNVLSMTLMSELVLKTMATQRRGIIINVSSFCGVSEFPLYAAYSASKAYVNTLSSALAAEYADYGIIVQTVVPNQVNTKASRNFYDPKVSVNPDVYVEAALRTVGREQLTSGHLKHKIINNLFVMFGNLLPKSRFNRMKLNITAKAKRNFENKA